MCSSQLNQECGADSQSESLTPTHKVFGTFELLETILASVSQRELLLLQRVSRTWNETIGNSSVLQSKLCYLPTDRDIYNRSKSSCHSELRVVHFDPMRTHKSIHDQEKPDYLHVVEHLPASEYHPSTGISWEPTLDVMNPLFLRLFQPVIPGWFHGEVFEFAKSAPQFRVDGSWKRMSLTKEPIKSVVVGMPKDDYEYDRCRWQRLLRQYYEGLLVTRETGLTIGDIYHVVSHISSQCAKLVKAHPEMFADHCDNFRERDSFDLRIIGEEPARE